MNPELIDRIEEAIKPLADAASQGAEFAWGALVRQAVLQGAVLTSAGLVTLAVTVFFVLFGRRTYRYWQQQVEDSVSRFDRESTIFGIVVLIFASAASLLATLILLGQGILRLANPGYYALEYLARVVGA